MPPPDHSSQRERRDLLARSARDRLAVLLGVHPRRLASLTFEEAEAEAERQAAARLRMRLAD